MNKKRGISPLIGSVLIIAFVVILFVLITTWTRRAALEPGMEFGEEKVASTFEQANTNIKLMDFNLEGNDKIKIKISNEGTTSIKGIAVKVIGSSGSYLNVTEFSNDLVNLEVINQEISFDANDVGTIIEKIEVTPIVSSGYAVSATRTKTINEEINGGEPPINGCPTATTSWQNYPFGSTQTGTFVVEYDATPNDANIDGIIALSSGEGLAYADFAVLTRFNSDGNIDSINGALFYTADNVIPYTHTPVTNYHFRLEISVPSKTYSVYVTPEGGSEQEIGIGYEFRTDQITVAQLDNWGIIESTGGSFEVCNFVLSEEIISCAAQGGNICQTGETCDGDIIPASDSSDCCYGNCITEEPPVDCSQVDIICVDADGTKENTTIQQCADIVQAGQTCLVYPGTYDERVTITNSGTSDTNRIIIKAINKPIISFPNNGQSVISGRDVGATYDGTNAYLENPSEVTRTKGFDILGDFVRVENFEITNIGSDVIVFNIANNNAEIINNYAHELEPSTLSSMGTVRTRWNADYNNIKVKGNVFWRIEGIAIFINGNNWIVEGNDISHGSDITWLDGIVFTNYDSDAIRFFGSGHIIRNNTIHDYIGAEMTAGPHPDAFQTFSDNGENEAYDILIDSNYVDNMRGQIMMLTDQLNCIDYSNTVYDITVRNNVFKKVGSYGIQALDIEYFTFENNVVTESFYGGLLLGPWGGVGDCFPGSHHATVRNNIFYNDGSGSMLVDEKSKVGSVWDYNMHYPDFTWPIKQPEYDIHGIYGIDPLFVDPAAGDYSLQENSDAVDAGITISEFNYDIIGTLRPQGDGWDMGAYESG